MSFEEIKGIFIESTFRRNMHIVDVPFTNGEIDIKGPWVNLSVDDIECDESIISVN